MKQTKVELKKLIMKKVQIMKKVIYVFVVVLFFSCGNNKKKNETIDIDTPSTKNVIQKDNILKIAFDIKVKEDDKFQLFYIDESPESKYNVDSRIVLPIQGSDEYQLIKFEFPPNILPYKFRVDVGENKNETLIKIRSVKLTLNNNTIEFDGATIDKFFQPNIYLNKAEDGYERKKVDGRYDPFFTSKAFLIKKMELEL